MPAGCAYSGPTAATTRYQTQIEILEVAGRSRYGLTNRSTFAPSFPETVSLFDVVEAVGVCPRYWSPVVPVVLSYFHQIVRSELQV